MTDFATEQRAAPVRVADLDARPATIDDAAAVADVLTAIDPDDPTDPEIQRFQWETAPPWPRHRFALESGGKIVGFAFQAHAPWEEMPDRFGFLGASLDPAVFTPARLDAAYTLVEDLSRADGTRTFTVWLKEKEADHIAVVESRGYKEERRGKGWELDLRAERDRLERMAAESRERMRREGISILTLAEDRDPDAEQKLWRMSTESFQDIPTTVPFVLPPFEQWCKWLLKPGIRRDRVWIARDGDDVVGVSVLSYPPTRGNVWTDYTGTARKVRGRGVARALKLETVMQAIALGTTRVRTGNDGANAPILHLNEELGYKQFGTGIQFLKPA